MRRNLQIREEIVPSLSTKLLDIYLSENETEIFSPTTQRKRSIVSTQNDSILNEIIQEKIDNEIQKIPLVLRKRKLYENSIKNIEISQKEIQLSQIATNSVVPIIARKFLLLKQARAS